MAFLSAPAPDWSLELGQVGGAIGDELAAAVPGSSGWFLRPDVFGEALLVSVNHAPGRRRDVIVAAGRTVARLWPGWLGEAGIDLTVWMPGLALRVPCAAMVGLAVGDLDARGWWDAGRVTLG